MAEQAIGLDRPIEVIVERVETRGQIPSPFPGIPRQWGLEKKANVFDQIGGTLAARADHELDLSLVFGDDLTGRVASSLLVKNMTVRCSIEYWRPWVSNRVWPPPSSPFITSVSPMGRDGAAHRVLAKRTGAFGVAADTRRIAEILHLRPSVLVGRGKIFPTDNFQPRVPRRKKDYPGAHHHDRGEQHEPLKSQFRRSRLGFDRALQLAILNTGPGCFAPAQRTLHGTTCNFDSDCTTTLVEPANR